MAEKREEHAPGEAAIKRAFDELFAGGDRVRTFRRSGLRYVDLGDDAILVEQNLAKKSEWAEKARGGAKIAWMMRDGEYLARVVDGDVTVFD